MLNAAAESNMRLQTCSFTIGTFQVFLRNTNSKYPNTYAGFFSQKNNDSRQVLIHDSMDNNIDIIKIAAKENHCFRKITKSYIKLKIMV